MGAALNSAWQEATSTDRKGRSCVRSSRQLGASQARGRTLKGLFTRRRIYFFFFRYLKVTRRSGSFRQPPLTSSVKNQTQ